MTWPGFLLLRIGANCDHGIEHLSFIKCRDFSSVAEEPLASSKTLLHGVG
jgi:hypothetical protein